MALLEINLLNWRKVYIERKHAHLERGWPSRGACFYFGIHIARVAAVTRQGSVH